MDNVSNEKQLNLLLIKKLGNQFGWSVKEVAGKVGLSQAGLHNMIKENNMKMDAISRIADLFRVPIAYFFDEAEVQTDKKTGEILCYDVKQKQIEDLKAELADKEMLISAIDSMESHYEDEIKKLEIKLERCQRFSDVITECLRFLPNRFPLPDINETESLLDKLHEVAKGVSDFKDELLLRFLIEKVNEHSNNLQEELDFYTEKIKIENRRKLNIGSSDEADPDKRK